MLHRCFTLCKIDPPSCSFSILLSLIKRLVDIIMMMAMMKMMMMMVMVMMIMMMVLVLMIVMVVVEDALVVVVMVMMVGRDADLPVALRGDPAVSVDGTRGLREYGRKKKQ